MKQISSFSISLTLVVGLFLGLPSLADHSSDQYSFSANVTAVERVDTRPIPTLVTWVQSNAAEEGSVILDHFEVVLLEDDIELGRVSVAPDVYTLELNKKNIPDMKVYSHYVVQVDEMYTDGSSSDGFSQAFYTAPPKLKNIRVINKVIEEDGDLTITLKWRQPTSLREEYLNYDYKISNVGKPDQLLAEDDSYDNTNSITIKNLPAKSMQIRVRARDSDYGEGQWSAWKKFHSPEVE